MTRVRYTGIHDPKQAFEALAPLRRQIIQLQTRVRPFGVDYLILQTVTKALDTAAYHFTGEPDFYAREAPRS
jgi:hypothetical protein